MSSIQPALVAVVLFTVGTHVATLTYYGITTRRVPCVFPFYFNGYFYSHCIHFNNTMWCSTTDNYTRDGQGGECLVNDACRNYKILSEPWRNVGFNFSQKMNDSNLTEGWYRFSGIGGDRMGYSCLNIVPCETSLTVKNTISSSFQLITCDVVSSTGYHLDCGEGLVLYYLVPVNGTYITRHSSCVEGSCGDHARCGKLDGSCECDPGISIPNGSWPTGDSYGCSEPVLQIRTECVNNYTPQCAEEFLENIRNVTAQGLPKKTVEKYLELVLACLNTLEKTNADQNQLVKFGNAILNAVETLVSLLVRKTDTCNFTTIKLQSLDVQVFVVGRNANFSSITQLKTSRAAMDIDLIGISKNNNGSAAVAFVTYSDMGSLLSPNLFNTTNITVKTMMSTVVSATLPKTNDTQLTKPVNFTMKHIAELKPGGVLSCVYWSETEWITDGCYTTHTNSSHTTCSCVHLSTFALIMQWNPGQDQYTKEKSDPFWITDLLGTIAVAVGLVFLCLALLTIAFCRRGMRVTNTALINLCMSLLLAHLLFLLTQNLLLHIKRNQLACAALAGVLHFLFLSAFVWMLIEAVLLFISVKNLTKIRSKQKEVLSWKCLIIIGYLIPLVVVGVSVGLFPDGYGSEQCWLKTDRNFTWSFLGPVCIILAINVVLFIVIIIMLKLALNGLKCEVSQFRQTRILVFKTLLQFIILGGPWILGLFTSGNKVLEIVFVFLNSQQGTFIFLVHCVLNQEVREQYRKWLRVVSSCCRSTTPTAVKKN